MQRVTGGRRLAARSWTWLDGLCERRDHHARADDRPSTKVSAPAEQASTLIGRMRDQQLDLEVGRRVHLLVGLAIGRGLGPRDLPALAAEVFATWPTTKALAPSARLRCVTAAATYLARCMPLGFELVGVEEPLGQGVADLIWCKGYRIVVDEMKTGKAAPHDPSVSAQVLRLIEGGAARWGTRFVGVRVLPLAGVRNTWLQAADGSVHAPIGARTLAVR